MLLPWLLCALLAILLVGAVIKIIILEISIKEICVDFERCVSEDTNSQILISSGDRTVRKFAKAINSELSELRKMELKYAGGDMELKEAVTNISHDLRTPLTAISGYLDLLENTELPETARKYTAQIRNRTEALARLTEELFRYSVVLSLPELKLEKVNVCPVLEETLISFQGDMEKAGIEPEIIIPDAPVTAYLDRSALARIFGNIIGNAVKYSDGDFYVRLDQSGRIEFSNTAKELSAVEVGKLFDRFYTVDTARKSTGLGLSIAKLLTERMNGSIAADYKDDRLMITVDFSLIQDGGVI